MKKIFNKIMIIDGSYMMHRNLKVSELWDLSTSSGIRSGGVFGFLRSLNYTINSQYFPIIVWDSKLSERRLNVYPDYKHNLSKSHNYAISDIAKESINNPDILNKYSDSELAEIKQKVDEIMNNRRKYNTDNNPDDYLYQYSTQRNAVINICTLLGIPSIKISGWEGDDLMVLLSRISNKSIIITDDKDLLQLLNPNTDVNRIMQKQYWTYNEYLSKNDLLSIREVVIHKAIVGDPSDNIPSVTADCEYKYSVGSKTASKIARIIVENEEDSNKYIPALLESSISKNKIKGFVDNHDNYIRNLQLVDLSLVENDMSVISKIESEVISCAGYVNLFKVLDKLKFYEITSVDVNSIISNCMKSRSNCYLDG